MDKIEVRFSSRQRKFLDEISELMEQTLDLSDAKIKMLTKIGKFLNVDRVLIGEFDSVKGLFLQADKYSEYLSSNKFKTLVGTSAELPSNKGVKDHILKKQRLFRMPDLNKFLQEQNLLTPEFLEFLKEYNIQACIVTPIFHSNQFLGILAFHFGRILDDREFDQEQFLTALADKIKFILIQSNNLEYRCDLSRIVGLSPAVTYKALASRYNKALSLFKINDKDFCNISIEELKASTCLYSNEIKNAIEKLNELCLVDIRKNSKLKNEFSFRPLDYENFVNREFVEQNIKEIIYKIEKGSCLDDNLLKIKDFISKIEKNYSNIKYFEYTIHFLNSILIYDPELKLNKTIFLCVYKVISAFVENNELDLNSFNNVIEKLFETIDATPKQIKVISFNQSFLTLAKRLKLILFYKLKDQNFNQLNPDLNKISNLFKIDAVDSYC